MRASEIFDRKAPMSIWSFVVGFPVALWILFRMPEGTSTIAGIMIPVGAAIVVEHIIRTWRYVSGRVGRFPR